MGIRHFGTVCDKCGVEVTHSKVRRERMGHIELAVPVAHVGFLRELSQLLNVLPHDFEQVIYFASYLVTGVNEERKAAVIEEINEEHEATVGELRADAEHELRLIDDRLKLDVENVAIGDQRVSGAIRERREKDLAILRAEYEEMLNRLVGIKGQASPRGEYFRGRLIVDEDERINHDRLETLAQAFVEEAEKFESGATYDAGGPEALAGAVRDQLTYGAEERKGRIEQLLAEQIKEAERERDETLKAINALKELQILSGTQFRELQEIVPPGVFNAGIGAEAVYEYVSTRINLHELSRELGERQAENTGSDPWTAAERFQLVRNFLSGSIKPERMMIVVIPVVPPTLRPMDQPGGIKSAAPDLNRLYRHVINRNNRTKRLLEIGAPDHLVRHEKRMLQEAVDALINGAPIVTSFGSMLARVIGLSILAPSLFDWDLWASSLEQQLLDLINLQDFERQPDKSESIGEEGERGPRA